MDTLVAYSTVDLFSEEEKSLFQSFGLDTRFLGSLDALFEFSEELDEKGLTPLMILEPGEEPDKVDELIGMIMSLPEFGQAAAIILEDGHLTCQDKAAEFFTALKIVDLKLDGAARAQAIEAAAKELLGVEVGVEETPAPEQSPAAETPSLNIDIVVAYSPVDLFSESERTMFQSFGLDTRFLGSLDALFEFSEELDQKGLAPLLILEPGEEPDKVDELIGMIMSLPEFGQSAAIILEDGHLTGQDKAAEFFTATKIVDLKLAEAERMQAIEAAARELLGTNESPSAGTDSQPGPAAPSIVGPDSGALKVMCYSRRKIFSDAIHEELQLSNYESASFESIESFVQAVAANRQAGGDPLLLVDLGSDPVSADRRLRLFCTEDALQRTRFVAVGNPSWSCVRESSAHFSVLEKVPLPLRPELLVEAVGIVLGRA